MTEQKSTPEDIAENLFRVHCNCNAKDLYNSEKEFIEAIAAAIRDAAVIKLPKEHDIVGSSHPEKYGHAFGWNDCLKELRRIHGIPDKDQLAVNARFEDDII